MAARQPFQPVGHAGGSIFFMSPHHRSETILSVRLDRIAAQMKMRAAITQTRAARMTAEGDGLALFVAAIRIAAIAALQLDQGTMPRFDANTAQFDRHGLFEDWRRPGKRGALK